MLSRRHFLLGVSLLLAGCTPQTTATNSKFPTDALKREVALKQPAKRVVAIGPAAVEIIFALGAGSQLVGRDDFSSFPPEAKKVAVAGTYQGPNVEQCVALKPDLVIVQFEGLEPTRVNDWQTKIGAPVGIIGAATVKDAGVEIQKIADWLGVSEKGKPMAAALEKPTPITWNKSKAFIEIGRSPLYTAGQNTLVGDVVNTSGFENVAKVRGYQAYNIENLLVDNPDVYIVTTTKSRADTIRELRANPSLSKLKCIQKGRVITVDSDLILRPGPRLKDGIAQLTSESKKLANSPQS